jgi:hypothetical protein
MRGLPLPKLGDGGHAVSLEQFAVGQVVLGDLLGVLGQARDLGPAPGQTPGGQLADSVSDVAETSHRHGSSR